MPTNLSHSLHSSSPLCDPWQRGKGVASDRELATWELTACRHADTAGNGLVVNGSFMGFCSENVLTRCLVRCIA